MFAPDGTVRGVFTSWLVCPFCLELLPIELAMLRCDGILILEIIGSIYRTSNWAIMGRLTLDVEGYAVGGLRLDIELRCSNWSVEIQQTSVDGR